MSLVQRVYNLKNNILVDSVYKSFYSGVVT